MERIGIFDARARLSELVGRVEAGEEVVLTRRGKPVVRLVRAEQDDRAKTRAAAVRRIRALSKKLDLRVGTAELRKAIATGRD
ncbi:MAG: type II toxin-antitoxin system prevent-host-death family antitoxin [Betaproteobacteria bacterium]|nr:type II toxin-antitoxin system prevent-host-death family antitoxin [Betaproteobacteria bacterium]